MHIALLSNEYPPLLSGGIGSCVRNLARELVSRGHRVSVLGWKGRTEFEDQGVSVRFIGETTTPKMGWLLNRRALARELNRMVREEGLDIVEAPDWCGMSAGMRPTCPLVVRCHGSATYFSHLLEQRVRPDPVRPSVYWAEQLALRQADSIVAVSEFTAQVTRQLFRLSRPVGVIHNGICGHQFRSTEETVTSPILLYVGTMVRKKGVLDVCRSFSKIAARHPTARLVLVGRDSKDQLTGNASTWALCKELLTPDAWERTSYLGEQPYDRVQQFFRQAAVCMLPSYAEACALVWIEAMACEKPMVAYDIGWAREIVAPGETGFLVPAGDTEGLTASVLRFLGDSELRQRFGVAARRRVEQRFTIQLVADHSLAWYERVLFERRN